MSDSPSTFSTGFEETGFDEQDPYRAPQFDATKDPAELSYRAVSKTAVASLIFTLLAPLGIFFVSLNVFGLIGFAFGVFSLTRIRRYSNELTGKRMARICVAASSLLFVGSVSWHSYVYLTEVPDGYHRISWGELQPDARAPRLPVSQTAVDLNGKKVFIKGYVFPGDKDTNLKEFVLVRDFGSCCFGKKPKLTHMIEVTLEDPLRIDYSLRLRNIAGTLVVDPTYKPESGERGGHFKIVADHLR